MKKFAILLCAACIASGVSAQKALNKTGASIEQLVPAGWDVKSAEGDLDKDGIADLVVIATPNYESGVFVREDGYKFNLNQPILGIYFGKSNGGYRLFRQYDKIIPHQEDEFHSVEPNISISDRGSLSLGFVFFSSAGSYGSSDYKYVCRYKDGDFQIIGYDYSEFSRNNGNVTTDSYNYLTNKKQTVKYNEFDESIPKKETWKKIPKRPLMILGSKPLEGEFDE